MANGDDQLGPLMTQPRARFKHEIKNPYLNVVTWAQILRKTYDNDPSSSSALFVSVLLRMQMRTITRLREEISKRGGDGMVGKSLAAWTRDAAAYEARLDYYQQVVLDVRSGDRDPADLHTHWYLPLFEGDYSKIVGMSKAAYDKAGEIPFGFIPPQGWPPDTYNGAMLYNQVAQAEDALSPFDFVNRVVGWGRAAERELSRSAPGEKATWRDKFEEIKDNVVDAANRYLPTALTAGKFVLASAAGLALLGVGIAVYGAHKRTTQLIGSTA